MTQAEAPEFALRLRAAGAGDEAAIAWLWRRHQPVLLGWLRSVGPEAEDAAADAWLDVLKSVHRFKGTEKGFRSWLFTVARRRMIDRQRRTGRHHRFLSSAGADSPAPDASGDALGSIEAAAAVRQIQALLSPEQAEAVLLKVLGDLSPEQIAEVMGKKVGAVRVLQHRGLRRLAEELSAAPGQTISENMEAGVTE